MSTGYSRKDTTNNIADGNIISATDLDAEFDGVAAAFDEVTGHDHDGTADNGAPITKVGPAQDVVVSGTAITPKTDNIVDLGSSSLEFKDLYIDGTANIDSLVADTADINGGTVDSAAIGSGTPSTGAFTTLTSNSTTTLNGTSIPANKTLVVTTDIGSTVQAYDTDLAAWAGVATAAKQDTLVSGTNIKTVNSTSLLGSGDVAVQATLVSGTNIKTVNSTSLLGSGNIAVGTVTDVTGTAPIVSSGGTTPAISISAATTSAAGSMSSADKTKLDGIAAGAQVNVATNLAQGTRTSTAVPVTSSTGSSATLDVATTSLAGVMSAADKTKLDGAVTEVTGTAPIVSSGGATPAISISAATTSAAGSMSSADKTKLDGIASGANNYSLPAATSTTLGGVELFSDTVQSVAANAVTTTADRTYGIQLNANNQAVVNIPWTGGGSGTVTSIVAGTGLSGGTITTSGTIAIDSTVATLTGTQTLTNKRINPRAVAAGATSGSLAPNGDTTDVFNAFGLTGAITAAAPTGTPVDGQRLMLRFEDNGTARAITWTTSAGAYRAIGVTLPTTTVAAKVTYVGCVYNTTDGFWDVVAIATQA